ncbi:hypothetical protein T02_2449 [Trichinella nativa]|uniref:Uncharacterized protein n=1 Tax=Trichinella nativa TaxID=6335 RepID=A0A0V1KKC4_9BILA|nr:hypothetical protein T02_2449 [Trichinella nativa]
MELSMTLSVLIVNVLNTLESKMESIIINRSKTIKKVQQTYTGGSRLRFSRDMQKKVRTVPMY